MASSGPMPEVKMSKMSDQVAQVASAKWLHGGNGNLAPMYSPYGLCGCQYGLNVAACACTHSLSHCHCHCVVCRFSLASILHVPGRPSVCQGTCVCGVAASCVWSGASLSFSCHFPAIFPSSFPSVQLSASWTYYGVKCLHCI